jgi:sporulation protein YlmC with PRC-barrel domain
MSKKLPKGLSIVSVANLKIAKLYDTNIVIVDGINNLITINTGGWYTRHTKKCINLVLNSMGLYLTQKNFKWNLYRNGTYVGTVENNLLQIQAS